MRTNSAAPLRGESPAPRHVTSLAELNAASRADFTAALGHLFEHSRWVAEETWPKRPFRDAEHLHGELCATMRAASPQRQLALICAHPDLAGRLALAGKLTAESAREQAGANLDKMNADELAALRKSTQMYRKKFGFPFIICARLNARDAILRALQARVKNSREAEFTTALTEIEKIARLRLGDCLSTC